MKVSKQHGSQAFASDAFATTNNKQSRLYSLDKVLMRFHCEPSAGASFREHVQKMSGPRPNLQSPSPGLKFSCGLVFLGSGRLKRKVLLTEPSCSRAGFGGRCVLKENASTSACWFLAGNQGMSSLII